MHDPGNGGIVCDIVVNVMTTGLGRLADHVKDEKMEA
jgi:hypothetical protein